MPTDNVLYRGAQAKGCYHPVLIYIDYVGSDERFEKISNMVGALARLANDELQQRTPLYDEAKLVFLPCRWTEHDTGKRRIGLMVGTSNPDVELPQIPAQQLRQSLKNVQHHLIGGEQEGVLSGHWQLVPTNLQSPLSSVLENPLNAVYSWTAETAQEKDLVRFMAVYAELQNLHYKLDDRGDDAPVTLFVKKEDLEQLHTRECVPQGRGK